MSVVDALAQSAAAFMGGSVNGTQWPSTLYAIRQWVIVGSGLDPTAVTFYGQNQPRPSGPWISLRLRDDARPRGWRNRIDQGGDPVLQYVRGRFVATLDITCYAGMPNPTNPNTQRGPVQILGDVLASLELESVGALLSQYKVGTGTRDKIRSTDGVINTAKYEPRAIVSVQLHLTSELAELSTWIDQATADGTGPLAGVDVTATRT